MEKYQERMKQQVNKFLDIIISIIYFIFFIKYRVKSIRQEGMFSIVKIVSLNIYFL